MINIFFFLNLQIDWGGFATAEPTFDIAVDCDIDVSDAGIVLEAADGDTNDTEFELIAEKDSEKWEIEEVEFV